MDENQVEGSSLLIKCILLSLITSACYIGLKDVHLGIIANFFCFIFALAGGTIGAFIGYGIRSFIGDVTFFTSGGVFSILWEKIFWTIGIQFLGALFGSICGGGVIIMLVK